MTRNVWIGGVGVAVALVVLAVWLVWPEEVIPPTTEEVATSTPEVVGPAVGTPSTKVIGTSVEGRPLTAYTYGTGETELLFVGGIHGGYEWNSVYLAYRMMDYLQANPNAIPANVSVTIIPSANPDGLYDVVGVEGRFAVADVPDAPNTTGLGRFNANDVDLNRNFDCKWQSESMWRGNKVSAGASAFSEPEARAIRDFVVATVPTAAIFWHSQANTVYASECEEGILPETLALMKTYAVAASYGQVPKFDAYPVTGDVEGWLASIGIPAITVELETHDSTDWERNVAGVLALFAYYQE